jgi:hypothetical protein
MGGFLKIRPEAMKHDLEGLPNIMEYMKMGSATEFAFNCGIA